MKVILKYISENWAPLLILIAALGVLAAIVTSILMKREKEKRDEEYAKMLSDWGIDEETTCSRKTLFIEITDRGENIVRKESDQEIRWSGAIGQDQKCKADIEVLPTGVKFMYDGVDHSVPNANGLHIIVYSNSEDRIIDSVCFTPVSNGDVYWSIRNF